MSNRLPDMTEEQQIPYCIWHPDLATEKTYRRLVIRYPHMRYHVGRACAVAGHFGLYMELDLLPDLSIAEEARDNRQNTGSRQILEGILAQPCRWIVMNDYNRCIDTRNALFAVHEFKGIVYSNLNCRRKLAHEQVFTGSLTKTAWTALPTTLT